ncbi:S-layer homology domain-containing protein [Leucobacter salsicius]|uniref:S-layer homology domain-containing protein n=1 Tax=Leucobacter salsicius TaxID=664638 RepID=UPI000344EB36|nr:S-layer homology domain-containing protein [Leucobacter salsicius]
MSVSLRTIASATLAFALTVGLVTQIAVAQPAFATETSAADAQTGAEGAPGDGTGADNPPSEIAEEPGVDDVIGIAQANAEGEPSKAPDSQKPSRPAGPDAPAENGSTNIPLIDEEEGARLKAADAGAAMFVAAASPLIAGFKAGNIISDGNFYYSGAMTVSEIQKFLNQKVPRCTIGDPGRKPGTKAVLENGMVVGIVGPHCLVNMRLDTTTQTSQYCKPYRGTRGESAAQIIAKTSVACGISPKVLLVMVEKEQSLVGDSWPTVRQLNYATGANCPDSGPGNTANCDPKQKGFAVQIYKAGQLLRWYAANNGLNYHPKQVNTIQWHEKADRKCGTSNVYIENLATASLYTYTPYRPNQAALNAGWGKGDRCSSYGNRNFYMFYKLWFGSTHVTFPDVPEGHQYFKEIEWMGKSGISTGTEKLQSTVFEPMNGVTRRAMAAFLYRMEGSPKVTLPEYSPFSDVKRGDSFYKEIVWMYQKRLANGYKKPGSKNEYRPMAPVTRGAMSAFLFRLTPGTGAYQEPPVSPFTDVKKTNQFYREISWMRSFGISVGYSDGPGKRVYKSGSTVTRQAMAAFLYRLKHKK